MKFTVMAALLGSTTAVQLNQKSYMADMCKDMNKYDMSLVELEDEPAATAASAGVGNFNSETKNIRGTMAEHMGKTKAEIDTENKHILETQAKCMDFVNAHQDHPAVCNWCHANSQPESGEIWQWNPEEGVWYKWSGDRYHYWGPSKEGLKHDWSWYQGFWHHNGYVYKYENKKWFRFQGGEWVEYHETIEINPEAPHGKECREFLKLEQAHIPESLTEHNIPRCQVGEGAQKVVYEWSDDADCTFLGGAKVFQKNFKCADGSGPQFRTVEVCVQGPELARDGLNYATGQAHPAATATIQTKAHVKAKKVEAEE
jgi:hypothetical protein